MKKTISVLILSVFIGGILLSSAGCKTPPYMKRSGSKNDDGHSGHSH